MQIIGRWLSGWGPDQVRTQDDADRRVDAVIERVNGVVRRSERLPNPPSDQWENEGQ